MTPTRLALLVAAALLASAGSASARWCSYYDPYTYNCGFRTFEQCLANISGMGGFCSRDVYSQAYAPETEGRGPDRPRRRSR